MGGRIGSEYAPDRRNVGAASAAIIRRSRYFRHQSPSWPQDSLPGLRQRSNNCIPSSNMALAHPQGPGVCLIGLVELYAQHGSPSPVRKIMRRGKTPVQIASTAHFLDAKLIHVDSTGIRVERHVRIARVIKMRVAPEYMVFISGLLADYRL
jgi:hypothetical protein